MMDWRPRRDDFHAGRFVASLLGLVLVLSALHTPLPGQTPTPAPIIAIEGPARVNGTFMLVVKADPRAVLTARHVLPDGAPKPIELELRQPGQSLLWFQDPPAGTYLFRVRGQVAEEGLDPVQDAEHVVVVGQAPQPPPVVVPPVVDPPVTPQPPVPAPAGTAVTYVYEKDDGMPPSAVMAGLNRVNREKKIKATLFEDDTTNGMDQVPEQYKVAVAAARENGPGPVLVVTADGRAVNVVKAPKTDAEVWGAVK